MDRTTKQIVAGTIMLAIVATIAAAYWYKPTQNREIVVAPIGAKR